MPENNPARGAVHYKDTPTLARHFWPEVTEGVLYVKAHETVSRGEDTGVPWVAAQRATQRRQIPHVQYACTWYVLAALTTGMLMAM